MKLTPPVRAHEVQSSWSCIAIPPYVFIEWGVIKHRENFVCVYLVSSSSPLSTALSPPMFNSPFHLPSLLPRLLLIVFFLFHSRLSFSFFLKHPLLIFFSSFSPSHLLHILPWAIVCAGSETGKAQLRYEPDVVSCAGNLTEEKSLCKYVRISHQRMNTTCMLKLN
jgi:hypothetical protein